MSKLRKVKKVVDSDNESEESYQEVKPKINNPSETKEKKPHSYNDLKSDNLEIDESDLDSINESVYSYKLTEDFPEHKDLDDHPKLQLLFDLIFNEMNTTIDKSKFTTWVSERIEILINDTIDEITLGKVIEKDYLKCSNENVIITHKSGIKINYWTVAILRKLCKLVRSTTDTNKLKYYFGLYQDIYDQIDGVVKYIVIAYFVSQLNLEEKSEMMKELLKELRKYKFKEHLTEFEQNLYLWMHLNNSMIDDHLCNFIIVYNICPDHKTGYPEFNDETVYMFLDSALNNLYEMTIETPLYKFYNEEVGAVDKSIKSFFRAFNGKFYRIADIKNFTDNNGKYSATIDDKEIEINNEVYKKLMEVSINW